MSRTPRKLEDTQIDDTALKIDAAGVAETKPDEQGIDGVPEQAAVEKAADDSPTPEDVAAKLQKDLADAQEAARLEKARADRLEAAREVDQAKIVNAKTQALNSDYQKVESDIAAFNTELATLEQQQAEAWDVGDNRKAAELGRKIAHLDNKLTGAEYAKSQIEKLKSRAEAGEDVHTADNNGRSPAAAKWIAEHPKFETDPSYNNTAMAAHYEAQAMGHKVDSPEYFAHLDAAVARFEGRTSPRQPTDVSMAEPVKPKKESIEAPAFDGVPPSRSTGTEAGGQWLDNTTYRPTSEEIEAAAICGYVDKQGNADVAAYIRAKYPERFKRNA